MDTNSLGLSEAFTFSAHERFGVHLCFNHDSELLGPVIQVSVKGMKHPLAKSDLYFGDEAQNPQLRDAAGVVGLIYAEWAQGLPDSLRQKMKFSPLKNSGIDNKTARVSMAGISFETEFLEEDILDFHVEAARLQQMIREKMPDIERALEEGKAIALEDPNDAIRQASARALFEIARHPYVHAPSATERALHLMGFDHITMDYTKS